MIQTACGEGSGSLAEGLGLGNLHCQIGAGLLVPLGTRDAAPKSVLVMLCVEMGQQYQDLVISDLKGRPSMCLRSRAVGFAFWVRL